MSTREEWKIQTQSYVSHIILYNMKGIYCVDYEAPYIIAIEYHREQHIHSGVLWKACIVNWFLAQKQNVRLWHWVISAKESEIVEAYLFSNNFKWVKV